MTTSVPACVHHYICGLPVNGLTLGVCKHCGVGRGFSDPDINVHQVHQMKIVSSAKGMTAPNEEQQRKQRAHRRFTGVKKGAA